MLRALAYDLIRRRDGFAGWKASRDDFRTCVSKQEDSLRLDTETKVRNLVAHACQTSPYYKGVCQQLNLNQPSVFTLDDLQHFPFLTKDIIRQRRSELVSKQFDTGSLDVEFTSGTTGTRTEFYRNHDCTVSRMGRQLGILEQCGYRPGMKRALLWGVSSDLPAGGLRSFKHWFRNFADSQESLCCKVMSESDMDAYYAKLVRFKPSVLYGYPNAMARFGRFIVDRKLPPVKVKTIIATAERLTAEQRVFLESVYGGEVFNQYCTREYGCVGFECKMHHGFHIDVGSVYVEIVKDGRRVEPGETGEIVITDLLNYGMPLIRSRTGDIAALSPERCECGSALPLLKSFDGRIPDNIVRPDGSVVAGVLLSYLLMDIPAVRAAQYIQESQNDLNVLLEIREELTDEMKQEAVRQIRERVGSDMTVRITPVAEIPRNPLSGKFQEVISKIGR